MRWRIGIPEAEEHGADTGLGSSPFFFSSSVFGIWWMCCWLGCIATGEAGGLPKDSPLGWHFSLVQCEGSGSDWGFHGPGLAWPAAMRDPSVLAGWLDKEKCDMPGAAAFDGTWFPGCTALGYLNVSEAQYRARDWAWWVTQSCGLSRLQHFQASFLSRQTNLLTTALNFRPTPKGNVFHPLGEENVESSRTGSEGRVASYWLLNVWRKNQAPTPGCQKKKKKKRIRPHGLKGK